MEFQNGQRVTMVLTGFPGRIVGVADFLETGRKYLVEYVNAQSTIYTEWFVASALKGVA